MQKVQNPIPKTKESYSGRKEIAIISTLRRITPNLCTLLVQDYSHGLISPDEAMESQFILAESTFPFKQLICLVNHSGCFFARINDSPSAAPNMPITTPNDNTVGISMCSATSIFIPMNIKIAIRPGLR